MSFIYFFARYFSRVPNIRGPKQKKVFTARQKLGLLICTLIFENQGLEKLRSVSNLRRISDQFVT
jgi:hypothetical protein